LHGITQKKSRVGNFRR